MQNVYQFLLLNLFIAAGALLSGGASSQERAPTSDKTAARVLSVGTAREIRSLKRAAEIARDGDTIEVDPGDYHGDTAVWTQNDLVIRGTGARPRVVADGTNAAEGKGLFVIRGGNVTIENLGFFGARVEDRNGAGVRLERGRLNIVGCVFEDNENGILTSNDESVELRVINSTFLNNGGGDGQSHNLYAGTIAMLEVRSSYFARARTGHLLKSRAKTTSVYYSRLTGENGSSSYEMDLPNGGDFLAVGNLVQQGNQTENPAMISYGAEGYRWPVNRARITFNTLVNDRAQGGVFVAVRSGPAEAMITHNILVGRGELDIKTPASIKGNAQARADNFADPSKFDYRLRVGSPLVGTAGLTSTFGKEERPTNQYRHVAGSIELVGVTGLTPLSPGAFQRVAQ